MPGLISIICRFHCFAIFLTCRWVSKNMYIAGIDDFEGDTLFRANSINVVVDIVSAIKMKDIKIKRIFIDEPGYICTDSGRWTCQLGYC